MVEIGSSDCFLHFVFKGCLIERIYGIKFGCHCPLEFKILSSICEILKISHVDGYFGHIKFFEPLREKKKKLQL